MVLTSDYYADYFPSYHALDAFYDRERFPYLYFNFSWNSYSVCVSRYRHRVQRLDNSVYESCHFGVYVRGWFPDCGESHVFPKSKYEFCKEWHVVFASPDLTSSVKCFNRFVYELLFNISINMSDLRF